MRGVTQRGLTFVELLVAATMMSILFVGLGAHLRGGITVWNRATQTVEALQRQSLALEMLERDLANAFVYNPQPDSQPAPQFAAQAMRFFTVGPAGSNGIPVVQVVSYECANADSAAWLSRASQSVSEELANRPPKQKPLLQLNTCAAFSITYAYLPEQAPPPEDFETFDWQGQWDETTTHELPRLLRVSVQPMGRPGVTRVFGVPAGVLKSKPKPT